MDGRVMCAVSHHADNQLIEQLQDSESIEIMIMWGKDFYLYL